MRKVEAVIFDWAGTTVDYGCFAPVRAFIEVFEEYGISPTLDETREPLGMLKWDHIKTMMSMPRINKLWIEKYGREFTDNDIDNMHDKFLGKLMGILHNYGNPKPFVVETMKELRNRNIKIGSTTGYTDEMMAIVTKVAKENGYEPDCWFSPTSTNNVGRPYPFMVFKNLEALKVSSIKNVIKVGDTISDILEGKNAGLITVGIIEGSSEMALNEDEYNSLTEEDREHKCKLVYQKYKKVGADFVVNNIKELVDIIDYINK
ncbi:MAG: phosphonoacetaldehyde hydrolase [Peptostreptococcaceae bacterium]